MEDYINVILLILIFMTLTFIIFYMQYIRRERIEMQKEAVVGDMKYSSRTTDHNHWFICDGRSLAIGDYPELYDIIGKTYGSVDDLHYNLPDCRSRVLGAIGKGDDLTDRPIGSITGEEKHTMTIPELVSHTHTGTTASSGNHNHTGTTDEAGNHSHTNNAPGGNGNLGLVIANGQNTVTSTDNSSGEINVWTPPRALSINDNGNHTHTFTTSTNGAHTHTFTTNATGTTQPFNVMQPTIFAGNVFILAQCH